MPKKFESLKAQFIKDGLSEDAAAAKAARIFNAQRKPGEAPIGRKHREKQGKK